MNNGTSILFDRWPRFASRHPWRVVIGGLLIVAVLIAANSAAGGTYVDKFSIPGAESQEALDVLVERFPQQSGDAAMIVIRADDIRAPETQERVHSLIEELGALPGVIEVSSPYEGSGAISEDGTIARLEARYEESAFNVDNAFTEKLFEYREDVSTPDFQVELGGPVAAAAEQEPPGQSELIGIAAAIIILLLAFGSVVAMGLPILTALAGLIPGFMIIGIMSAFADMASFTPQFASMIGIGVGIDYALIIVTRFREGRTSGLSLEDAIVRAMSTAGKAVLFAGTIVVISLLGLWASGIPFLGWVASAAAVLVAALVAVALLILPAILRLLGRHIDKFSVYFIAGRHTSDERGIGTRWSRTIERRPVLFLVLSLAVLLTAASPILGMRLGSADAGSNPESSTLRRAYDLVAEGFGPGFNGPILIALELNGADSVAVANRLPDQIQQIEGIESSSPPFYNDDRSAAIITAIPSYAPQAEETDALVARLRDLMPQATADSGVRALVGGQTAAFIDIAQKMSSRMPLFFVAVIGLSVVLLATVFRSIIVPLKAALMIVLSVGVGFGVVTALFQWGWLSGLTGIDQTGPVESFLPMMLFAVLFGLSMDYEVFLVTRIHEEYLQSGDGRFAVQRGQAVTFRVIIAAALIMSSVFLSFALADFRVIKEFGLGLGIAILADALLIRIVLVPSIMHLVGNKAWWFPGWLDRILPRISVEAAPVGSEPAEK